MEPYKDAASFVDILRWRANDQADRTAFTFLQDKDNETTSWSYLELDRRARTIAVRLRSIEPRVRQALLVYPAGLEFIAAFWGCVYAGVTAVPVPPPRPNQSLSRFHAVAADAEAGVALTTSGQLATLERRLENAYSPKLQ